MAGGAGFAKDRKGQESNGKSQVEEKGEDESQYDAISENLTRWNNSEENYVKGWGDKKEEEERL